MIQLKHVLFKLFFKLSLSTAVKRFNKKQNFNTNVNEISFIFIKIVIIFGQQHI